MKPRKLKYLLFYSFFCPLSVFSQLAQIDDDNYLLHKDYLNTGKFFIDGNINAKGTPFLYDKDWKSAEIFLGGQHFTGIKLKYNIYSKELVASLPSDYGGEFPVIIPSDPVDSFIFENGVKFINSSIMSFDNRIKGFAVYRELDEFTYLIDFSKDLIDRYEINDQFGTFTDLQLQKYILLNGVLKEITGRKSLIQAFPDIKREIRAYFRLNRVDLAGITSTQFDELMFFCNDQLPKSMH